MNQLKQYHHNHCCSYSTLWSSAQSRLLADEIEQKIREYYKNNNDYDDTASIGSSESDGAESADLDGLGPDVDTDDLITPIPDDL